MAIKTINFGKVANENVTLSQLMIGREKISMDDLIKEYPNGVTVMEFSTVTYEDGNQIVHYPVFAFKEDDSKFFLGGYVLNKIVDSWLDACGADNEAEVSDALKEQGGVHMKFTAGKTKGGRNITNVEIIPQ